METLKELKELMEEKTKEKIQLLKELKKINLDMKTKFAEISKKIPKGKEKYNPDIISKKIEKLEFYISTTAYTPAREREAIRKIEELKKELKKSLEDQKDWNEIKKLKLELKEMNKQKKQIKTKLTTLIAQLDEIYKKIISFSSEKRGVKNKKIKKRIEQKEENSQTNLSNNSDSSQHYLTLGDILKINQNQQKP